MASQRWRFDLTWENGETFKMIEKLNEGDACTIIEMQENASLGGIWELVETICKAVFSGKLAKIGDDMKA